MAQEFTKAEIEEFKKQAIRFWETATDAHTDFYTNVSDRQRMAHGVLPTAMADQYASRPDLSAIAPPAIYINVQSLLAAITNIVFGEKPFGKVTLFGQPDRIDDIVGKAEAVLQNMNDIADEEWAMDEIIHQTLYAGLSCGFTQWGRKRERIVRRDENKQWRLDKYNNPVFDIKDIAQYATTIPLDIRRVRIDPSVDRLDDRKICGHHYLMMDYEAKILNRKKGHFYDFDEVALDKTTLDRSKYFSHVSAESDKFSRMGMPNEGFGAKVIEVKSIRGIFQRKVKDKWLPIDLVIDIANDNVVLGAKSNDLPIPGYKLYSFATVDSELGRMFPMGVVEPAEDMWIYLFMLMNNIIDRNTRDTHDMYLADSNAAQSLDDYIVHESGRITKLDLSGSQIMDVSQAFAPMKREPIPGQSFDLASIVTNIIQQTMKLNDYIQSGDPSRKETATAVTALVQGGQSLLMHLVRRLTVSLFRPAWQNKLILWNHFMGDQASEVYTRNNRRVDVEPGEINAMWQVDIETNAIKDRPDLLRRLVESFTMLLPLPEINRAELVRVFTESLRLPGRDRFLIPDDHLQAEIDRENLSIVGGIPPFVHPADNHQAHIQGHLDIAGDKSLPRKVAQVVADHIEAHQAEIEKINKGNLANTREVGIGQEGSPGMASQTHSKGGYRGMPAESR